MKGTAMDRTEKIALAIGTVCAVVSLIDYRRTLKREQQEKVSEIWQEAALDIAASRVAAERVKARIGEGHRYASVADIATDFQFERIAARLED